eukprot:TRINITY_DN59357_c0_g1_i1.p1 TRINITY_DN59357_c0_g1~~TRINITY_DN59357_c0_g1_i1.p1  ORF type:complete len:410 (-),score=94.87 TRINITY_DN59357_c0_g1_i1:118-1227(-)
MGRCSASYALRRSLTVAAVAAFATRAEARGAASDQDTVLAPEVTAGGDVVMLRRQRAASHHLSLKGEPATLLEQQELEQHGVAMARAPPFLFIGILSPPTHSEMRDVVRRTWLSQDLLTQNRSRHEMTAKFIVDAGEVAEREAKEHGDIVPLHVKEDSPAKRALEFVRWFAQNRKERFVLKLDDDTYPQLGRIVHLVHMAAPLHDHDQRLYVGRVDECHKAAADQGKAVHMAAGGYLLSRDLAEHLGVSSYESASKDAGRLPEGPTVGLWVAGAASQNLTAHYLALPAGSQRQKPVARGCQETDALSFGLSAQDMSCMWRQHSKASGGICCESAERQAFSVSKILLNAQEHQMLLREACGANAKDSWQI